MQITWLGHASFRIEIENEILLIDPWLRANPSFPDAQRNAAINGATYILITHGHGDHASEAVEISRETGARIVCIHELSDYWNETEGMNSIGFGKGGTVALGAVNVTMVNAVHSSSVDYTGIPFGAAGGEAGFMIAGEGHVIYVSGDTDIMADMDWMGDYHNPDIGILSCGGHYTMDMQRAAYAAKRYFNFETIIPCHYKTFPILAQSAQPLIEALADVDVREPTVMEPLEF
ncbi:metal-dependent hydrolase [Loktanella sp. S4079]|uniref:metal-dependent hydrolase n=1 Tax=Loktanella sp. S4079 TaxID=579483 RepID=UPI0005FA1401|nr:metal-dependent hydrolase [Loktanella sp. S4079]KJZ19702.1 hydrolase [Loktanella sp. S4079]